MENELKECIQSIFNALDTKSKEETDRMFGEAINSMKKSTIQLDKLDNFNTFINHKLNKGIRLLANSLHEPSICKDKSKPDFIYMNYDFLEHNVRELCTLKEGTCCCADKSRSIVKMYLNYSLTGEIPEFDPNIEKWWLPKFGTYKEWMDFCDGLYRLYYGYTEKYFKAYNALIKSEKRKYKHILHTWYIEFKDNKVVQFNNTWDENQDNPLDNECFDKGNYYVVYEKYVKDRGYELYEDEEFISNHYYKVPKDDIQKIYKVSEEKMI